MSDADPEKKRKKKRGKGGNPAELLVEIWLETQGWRVHRAYASRGGGGYTISHDLFGALDMLAIEREGIPEVWGIQVTTQSGRTERRKRVEAVAWPVAWRISLVSHERVPDPANRSRSLDFLKCQDLTSAGWSKPFSIPLPIDAIEARRAERNAAMEKLRAERKLEREALEARRAVRAAAKAKSAASDAATGT